MADSPAKRYIRAFGITSTSSALGVATGAPIGGPITGYLSRHRVSFVNIPIGIAAILTAAMFLNPFIPREKRCSTPPRSSPGPIPNTPRDIKKWSRFSAQH
jgi:MFS family permease